MELSTVNETSFNDEQLGADFYATLNSDLYNAIATTPDELNALGDMQDMNGDYIDTPENRALMAELFPDYTEQAKAKYLASKTATARPQAKKAATQTAPTIETAEGRYIKQARDMLTAMKANDLLSIPAEIMETELASGDSERVNKAVSYMSAVLRR